MKLSKVFLIAALTAAPWVSFAQAGSNQDAYSTMAVSFTSAKVIIGKTVPTAKGDYIAAPPAFGACIELMETHGGKLMDCDYQRFQTADGKNFVGMRMKNMHNGDCLMVFPTKEKAEAFWTEAQHQRLAGKMITRVKGSSIQLRCHCMEAMKAAQGKTVDQLYR